MKIASHNITRLDKWEDHIFMFQINFEFQKKCFKDAFILVNISR